MINPSYVFAPQQSFQPYFQAAQRHGTTYFDPVVPPPAPLPLFPPASAFPPPSMPVYQPGLALPKPRNSAVPIVTPGVTILKRPNGFYPEMPQRFSKDKDANAKRSNLEQKVEEYLAAREKSVKTAKENELPEKPKSEPKRFDSPPSKEPWEVDFEDELIVPEVPKRIPYDLSKHLQPSQITGEEYQEEYEKLKNFAAKFNKK